MENFECDHLIFWYVKLPFLDKMEKGLGLS